MKRQIDMFVLARNVRAAYAEPAFKAYRKVGKMIVDGLFRGNPELVRRPVLREFADVSGVPLNRLDVSVRLYVACKAEPKIADVPKVGPTHFSAVMYRDPADILVLLRNAADQNMTVEDLKRSLDKHPDRSPGKNQPRLPREIKSMRKIARLAGELADIDPDTLEPEHRDDALGLLMRIDTALCIARANFGIDDFGDDDV